MASPRRIIGIDPGLRLTGWGIVASDGPRLSFIACGHIRSEAKAPLATRLRSLFDGLSDVIDQHAPLEAAVEETFVNENPRATLKLGQARGMALLAPALADLPVAEYPPNLVKKSVVGAGHADKNQVQAMIGYLLPKATFKTADEADALAVAICHAHHGHQAALLRQTARASAP